MVFGNRVITLVIEEVELSKQRLYISSKNYWNIDIFLHVVNNVSSLIVNYLIVLW